MYETVCEIFSKIYFNQSIIGKWITVCDLFTVNKQQTAVKQQMLQNWQMTFFRKLKFHKRFTFISVIIY